MGSTQEGDLEFTPTPTLATPQPSRKQNSQDVDPSRSADMVTPSPVAGGIPGMTRTGTGTGTGMEGLTPREGSERERQGPLRMGGLHENMQRPSDERVGEAVRRSFQAFLDSFTIADPEQTRDNDESASERGQSTQGNTNEGRGTIRRPYVEQLSFMGQHNKTTLYVDYEHLADWDSTLATEVVELQYYRFEMYLRRAVTAFAKQHQPAFAETAAAAAAAVGGGNEQDGAGMQTSGGDTTESGRDFWISFYNLPSVLRMRGLRTERVGRLSSFCGTVTRVSEVRPELVVAAFKCTMCGTVCGGIEQQFRFTTPTVCTNPTCGNRTSFVLLRDSCKFVDWQRLRVQENPDEVPAGCMPRSIDVILRHENVERSRAGDRMVFTGSLIVIPDAAALMGSTKAGGSADQAQSRRNTAGRSGTASAAGEGIGGLKALGSRQLTYKLAFLANSVHLAHYQSQGDQVASMLQGGSADDSGTEDPQFTEDELEDIGRMRSDPNLYNNLVKSMAPKVFGHSDIKRAILLMLFGGLHKESKEGVSLRGDINVCVVGDPACAKSQFLKYVASFMPRTIYTSGKASTAAGLTASVVKDAETGEFCIEAGALMLADNGICCIDEFDKMDQKDQVAIHEAMEQQTISISKAGIQATLNARTSILAAANPAGGRYDKSKGLKYNIALPPAILSRFDLIHVMIDEPDDNFDYNLASHIVSVHQRKSDALHPVYTNQQLQRYITYARNVKPQLTPEASQALKEAYVRLRSNDVQPGNSFSYRMTVRQLESMIRLSEALARVHCEFRISPVHVAEAERLLKATVISVEAHDVDLDRAPMPESLQDFINHGQNVIQERIASAENAQEQLQEDEETFKNLSVPSSVSYNKFREITNVITSYLDSEEKKSSRAGEGSIVGSKQGDVMRWYMDELSNAGKFTSLDEMAQEYLLLQRVIEYLVHNEQTLIVVGGGEVNAEGNVDTTNRIIALNPNYVIE